VTRSENEDSQSEPELDLVVLMEAAGLSPELCSLATQLLDPNQTPEEVALRAVGDAV